MGCGDEHYQFWGIRGYWGEARWLGTYLAIGTQVCEKPGGGSGFVAAREGEGFGGGSHTQTDSIDDEVLRFHKQLLTNFVPFLV